MRTILIFFCLCCINTLQAEYAFSGIFMESDAKMNYWNNMNWNAFTSKHNSLRAKGYQLIDIEGQHVGIGKSGRFWGVWKKTNIKSRVKISNSWDDFIQEVKGQAQQGFALDDVESMLNRNGRRIYIGLYCAGAKKQKVYKFRTFQELRAKTNTLHDNGSYLTDVDPFKTKDGKHQFLAVFTQNKATTTRLIASSNWEEFNEDRLGKRRQGLNIVDYERYKVNGKARYLAIFRNVRKKDSFWSNLNWGSLKAYRQHLHRHKKMRLIDLEVHDNKGKSVAPPTYTGKFKNTPDIWQHMEVIEESRRKRVKEEKEKDPKKVFGSNAFCGPTAVSNGVMYWVKTLGYKKLNPQSQVEMVKKLGSDDYMKSFDGTGLYRLTWGLQKYLKDYGHSLKRATIQHVATLTDRNSLNGLSYVKLTEKKDKIDIKKFKKQIIQPKSTVILLWGDYKKNSHGELERTGGHFVTVVGYGENKEGELDKNWIVFHNPGTGDEKPKQEYCKLRPLAGVDGLKNSTLILSPSGKGDGDLNWGSTCKGKYLIKKAKFKDGATRYVVLDGLIDYEIK